MPEGRLPQRVEVHVPARIHSINDLIRDLDGSGSRDDELSIEAGPHVAPSDNDGPHSSEFTLVDSGGFPLITLTLVEESP